MGLFSKGDREAQELLSRLKNMYLRLPEWLRPKEIVKSNAHILELSNGSIVYALPTTGGESWTFSIVFCDEFDRFDNAPTLMVNVKPTIDAGGQMIVGSISDKDKPSSIFKNIFRSAWGGSDPDNKWKAIFLPWSARPDRDQAWYDGIVSDAVNRHGTTEAAMDEVNQQYPSIPEDALAPKIQQKRVPYTLLSKVYAPQSPLESIEAPVIDGLHIYNEPEPDAKYVIGADPAEGVGGDDSSACVLDIDTGQQMAVIGAQLEPKKVFPAALFNLAVYYNGAGIMVERNNHGHATIGELTELIAQSKLSSDLRPALLTYPYDQKPGWLSSPSGKTVTRGKVLMYDIGVSMIKEVEVTIHDRKTYEQISSIDTNTLRAPDGWNDDASDAFMLACCGRQGKAIRTRFFSF